MKKNNKNTEAIAQVENTEVMAQAAQVENNAAPAAPVEESAPEAPAEETSAEDKAAQAKAAADELMAKAKEAAEAAKQAAKEAKEAAKKAKAFTSRPVRKAYFVAYYAGSTECVIGQGDVHYCVEKAAIDEVVKQRNNDEEYKTIEVYKVSKADPENERTLISRIYIDVETKQVVID